MLSGSLIRLPFAANCCSRPGCGRIATSGGLPAAMRVPSTVGVLSPLDVKLTVAPVFVSKSSSTLRKLFCSTPDHLPMTLILVPLSWGNAALAEALGPLSLLLLSSPPQAAMVAVRASTAAMATRFIGLLSSRLRLDRQSGIRVEGVHAIGVHPQADGVSFFDCRTRADPRDEVAVRCGVVGED